LLIRTWKKEVEPSVMMGERTSGFETTWMRKTSAIDRLGSSSSRRQRMPWLLTRKTCERKTHLRSDRNRREMST
jgi:hypothetical protein